MPDRNVYDRYRDFGYSHFIQSVAPQAGKPVEVFSIEEQKNRLILSQAENLMEETKSSLVESTKWLPFFAERYNISASIKDYVVVPVIIMPSDLPNRNLISFPYEELTKANVEAGLLSWQTWRAKAAFADHVNSDVTKAKGIIFESSLRPMRNVEGNLWKVLCLVGFDRTRDPTLVNKILTGERKHYSMGAWSTHFTCSICGAVHSDPKNPTCEHVRIGQTQFSVYPDPKTNENRLGYLEARNIIGFEVSSVETPAYVSATTDPGSAMKMW